MFWCQFQKFLGATAGQGSPGPVKLDPLADIVFAEAVLTDCNSLLRFWALNYCDESWWFIPRLSWLIRWIQYDEYILMVGKTSNRDIVSTALMTRHQPGICSLDLVVVRRDMRNSGINSHNLFAMWNRMHERVFLTSGKPFLISGWRECSPLTGAMSGLFLPTIVKNYYHKDLAGRPWIKPRVPEILQWAGEEGTVWYWDTGRRATYEIPQIEISDVNCNGYTSKEAVLAAFCDAFQYNVQLWIAVSGSLQGWDSVLGSQLVQYRFGSAEMPLQEEHFITHY